jgi:hypothetical protein
MSGQAIFPRDWLSTGIGMSFIGATLNTGITRRAGIITGGRNTGRTIATRRIRGGTTKTKVAVKVKAEVTTIRPMG